MLPHRDAKGRYGYIDVQGEWVIPPQFKGAGEFSDFGLAVAEDRRSLKGVIDKGGEWVIRPDFESVDLFTGDLIRVGPPKSHRSFFVNRNGERRVPFDYGPELEAGA
jgi:hypothetical protein